MHNRLSQLFYLSRDSGERSKREYPGVEILFIHKDNFLFVVKLNLTSKFNDAFNNNTWKKSFAFYMNWCWYFNILRECHIILHLAGNLIFDTHIMISWKSMAILYHVNIIITYHWISLVVLEQYIFDRLLDHNLVLWAFFLCYYCDAQESWKRENKLDDLLTESETIVLK